MSIRGGQTTRADVKSVTLTAIVYRADGTIKEDLGEIAYHDKSKWKLLVWYIKHPKQLRHRIETLWRSLCPTWKTKPSPN